MKDENELRAQELGEKILASSRTELYLGMRFLDLALSGLSYRMREGTRFVGTDGTVLFYDPEKLFVRYRANPVLVNRAYLHTVLHCVFRHLWKQKRPDAFLWDAACDIAAESVLDGIAQRCIRMSPSWFRQNTYAALRKRLKVLTAETVYAALTELDPDPGQRALLEREFHIDDHTLWPDPQQTPPAGIPQPRQKWEEISRKTQTDMETFSRDPAKQSQALLEQVQVENRQRYDYRSFLRKFAVLREEPKLDPDAFDPVFYSYGLRVYGNMPLIEPQESREIKKIDEFVIAVDTSMSCSGELVHEFLKQTYSILRDAESFFRKVNIHIIQCDEKIRSDQKIGSPEELANYMNRLELRGNGGTDFRPVFRYVDELIAQGEFRRLRGLIYFTDGRGIYPKHRPAYDTAFVFLREDYSDAEVPPWAVKLILTPEDLDGQPGGPQQEEQYKDTEDLPHYEY